MKNKRKALRTDVRTPSTTSRKTDCASRPAKGKQRLVPEKFSKTIREKLGYYVYRLVDPRTGKTFYIGKGKGNRVFDHSRAVLKPTKDEDEFDLKTDLICDILDAGFPVTTIIHRHGLDEDTALEVEAALIDAYQELANVQSGHGSALRGCMSAEQVKALYSARVADFTNIKAIVIKIRQTIVDAKGSVYEAVRGAWRIAPNHAKGLPIVASVEGVIKGVFTDVKWRKSTKYPGRYAFTAKESQVPKHKALLNCLLPDDYCQQGQANPIHYT